jgi:hypothetical protein
LPQALAQRGAPEAVRGEWRVHFHVPIYLQAFGHLRATQRDILDCLVAARKLCGSPHFEVETYAWGVLPKELRQSDLAAGIAKEMGWFASLPDGSQEGA